MRFELAGRASLLVFLSFWMVLVVAPGAFASDGIHRMLASRAVSSGSGSSSNTSTSHHGTSSFGPTTIQTPVPSPITSSSSTTSESSSQDPPTSSATDTGSSTIPTSQGDSSTPFRPTQTTSPPSNQPSKTSSHPLIPSQGTTESETTNSASDGSSSIANPSTGNVIGSSKDTTSTTSGAGETSPAGGTDSTPVQPKPTGSKTSVFSSRHTVVPISSTNVITEGSTTITNAVTVSSTAPFPITLNTDDPQATSSVSSLQNDISVTLIPIISKLIDTPDKKKAQDVIDELDKVKPEAKNLLDRIVPDSKGSTNSCSGGGNPLSDLVKAITCIDDGLNKVKSEVEEGIENEFSDTKGLEETTTDMTELTEESDNEDDESSSSSSSSISSTSESCTSITTEDIYVECSAASAPGRKRQAATSCTTSTRAVTGCDVSALTTTTTAATSTSSGNLEQCGTGCASCASLSTPSATSASKRGLDLTKRTLTKPQDAPYNGDTGAFLVDQYLWAEWVPLGTGGRSNPTALYHELKNERYDMAVQGLYGCTSVVVVSEKAVYMSHFWEVPGFSQGDWGIGSQQRFEQEVLTPLEHGDVGSAIPGLRQYAGNNGAFSSQYRPAAYIIKPGSSGRPDYDKAYDKKVDQIVEKVKNILSVSTPPIPITYTRVGGNDFSIPQGKVLFQYDPVESRQATDSCPIQQAMERLWVENKPRYVHQRYWVAYDDQKVRSGNQKRDCPANATPGGQVPLPSGYESESDSVPSGTSSSSKGSPPQSLTPTPSNPLTSSTRKPTATPTSSDTTTSTEQSATSDQNTTTADPTATTEEPSTTTEEPTTTEGPPTTTEEPATTTEEAPTTTEEPPPPTTTTAAPEPTAQLAIAYVVNGMSNYWSVFQPDIGGALQWCGSSGKFDASGDISLKNVPYPDGDNNLDFEVDGMSDCVYSSDSDETAGTLSCPDLAEDVECTEIEDQSQEDCYGVLNAKMVVPKVYCAWA